MAPIRRYLRITKYSVLECRIYLDNPALAQSWLLNPRHPILPRVIEAVRPFVLPKLREERERSRKKSTKKRGIKDTVTEDDFEVSIFLTETSTRHSLLYKHKHFHDTTQTKLASNSTRLVGASREAPIDVEDGNDRVPEQQAAAGRTAGEDNEQEVQIRREASDDDDVVALHDLPTIGGAETATAAGAALRDHARTATKRRRGRGVGDADGTQKYAYVPSSDDDDNQEHDDDDDLFVDQNQEEEPPAKRRRDNASADELEGGRDDKKKLAMDISYEGFAIYGRVLCLVVKRREGSGKGKGVDVAAGRGKAGGLSSAAPGGQAGMMENWITSTQLPEAVANGLLDAS